MREILPCCQERLLSGVQGMNKEIIKDFTNDFVDRLPKNAVFSVRDIAKAYSAHIWHKYRLFKDPFDDTIGRYLRDRREAKGDVHYFDYTKSLWWKADHIATAEEREAYGR